MSIPQEEGAPIESPDQLKEFIEAGCKPCQDWKIGTEHEKFGYDKAGLKPLPYDGQCSVKSILEGLRDDFGWSPLLEDGLLIGLEKGSANVSLEPGGQLELSGAPLSTVHETCDEVNAHLRQVRSVADRIGAGYIGLGAAPLWLHEEMPAMPKGRYKLMTRYMDGVGRYGKTMMYRTCTVQVNLDYSSEADMVRKLRVAIALQPVATALFANSPFIAGKPNGHVSWRSRVWRDLDADRTGMIPFVFDQGFGFEAWVDYALNVPMYFVYRKGRYIDALGQSFRDFMKGRLPCLPGETPRISDWADHLTTIFTEARIKSFIEMRGADGGPWRRICALPALWVGLLYDQQSLDESRELTKSWTAETRESMRVEASRNGLKGRAGPYDLGDLALRILDIAESGLRRRSKPGARGLVPDETHFLDPLREIAESRETPADELLRKYHEEWQGDLSQIYSEYSY